MDINATTVETQAHTPVMAMRIPYSVIALAGYVAFLLAGFGTRLGAWQPIPLYAFFGLLVLLLQVHLLPARSTWATAYTVVASLFTLLFAADIAFNTSTRWHFTKAPLTYIILNALLFVVVVADAVRRRPDLDATARKTGTSKWAQVLAPATLAVDFAEIAILAYIAATLVNLLHTGSLPYLTIDLNQVFHVHLPARIRYLQDIDSLIALLASAVALLLLGLVAVTTTSRGGPDGTARKPGIGAFEALLGRMTRETLGEVLVSLRLVLGPLVFVSTGLALAALSKEIVHFFNFARHSTNVYDLLNPFGPASAAQYQHALQALGLIALAALTFIISVAIVDHDMKIVRHAFGLLARGGQTVALSLAFFLFSLAFLNAVLVILGVTNLEPFQVSVFAWLALLLSGLFALPAALRGHGR